MTVVLVCPALHERVQGANAATQLYPQLRKTLPLGSSRYEGMLPSVRDKNTGMISARSMSVRNYSSLLPASHAPPPARGTLDGRRLARVLAFVHAQLDSDLTLEELAREVASVRSTSPARSRRRWAYLPIAIRCNAALIMPRRCLEPAPCP